jgi:hypothetical protein
MFSRKLVLRKGTHPAPLKIPHFNALPDNRRHEFWLLRVDPRVSGRDPNVSKKSGEVIPVWAHKDVQEDCILTTKYKLFVVPRYSDTPTFFNPHLNPSAIEIDAYFHEKNAAHLWIPLIADGREWKNTALHWLCRRTIRLSALLLQRR